MKITVKNLEGRTLNFEIDADCTVEKLMAKISESTGTLAEQQRIIFKGQQLREGKTLKQFNVQEGSELHLVVRSEGGNEYYG